MHQPLALLAPALLATSVFAACSSAAGEQVADTVDAQVAKALDVGKGAVTTSCPDDAKAKKGARFDCDITVDGQTLSANVTFTTSKKFTYEFAGNVFGKDELETQLKSDLTEGLGAKVTTLDCPGTTLVVIKTGETIECSGTDETGSGGKVIVGLDDDNKAVIQDVTN